MPTQINCPDCGGTQIKETYLKGLFSKYEDGSIITSKCPHCKDGKIHVYTEAEMQKAIADEREGCAVECDKLDSMYYDQDAAYGLIDKCAEAIRSRGE